MLVDMAKADDEDSGAEAGGKQWSLNSGHPRMTTDWGSQRINGNE